MRRDVCLWSVRALFVTATGTLGLWFGEGERGLPGLTEVLAVVAAVVTGFAIPAGGYARRVAMAGMVVCSLGTGWWLGQGESSSAFNECVQSAEAVRDALASAQARTGEYPESLRALAKLPCRRLLRGTLLTYSRTPGGYSLKFSDSLVTHEATHEHSFIAHK